MATRIVEGQLPYTGGTGIGIDTNKVISLLLREENNLIKVNGDNEIYTDLQLGVNITPSDTFPVGVTVGKVLAEDGWSQNGLILNWKTTSGDYARWLYGADGKIYFDGGTGTWSQVYYSSEVDALFTALRNELATVAFTGDYNDLRNRPDYFQVQADWDQTDDSQPDYIKNKPTIPTVNDATLTIQKNGTAVATFTANSATATTANITVPNIQNSLTSTSTSDGLSAYQGKILNDKITDLQAIGRFLSLWDCSTGQPVSFPLSIPYNYQTGDYFLVETVSSATPAVNYRPNGVQYTGTASTTVETEEVEVGDLYIYDGAVWLLQLNHGKTVSFANLAGQPSDNANLASALNAKQDNLTAGTNIEINSNTISAKGLTILSYGNSTWNDFITAYNRGGLVYCRASSNSNPASGNQGRMAFMAYLNNPTTPTEVEFQYYRSRSSHSSAANQLDEVYVYKLSSTNGGTWTVEVRDTGAKLVAGTGIGVTVNSSGATISNNGVTSVNSGTGAVTVNDVKISSSAPASPIEGMAWYDTTNSVLKTYNGTSWDEAGGGGDVRVFAVPSVNDDISDMITRLSAGKGVILHEMVSGTDAFYKVDYHDDVNCEITASLIYSYNGGYARVYTIEYNYSTKKVSTKTPSLIYFFAPETAGTQGQVLTKTNSGYEWANASGGFELAPNSPLTPKYRRYGSQAQYDALTQYYTDNPGDTVYFTI